MDEHRAITEIILGKFFSGFDARLESYVFEAAGIFACTVCPVACRQHIAAPTFIPKLLIRRGAGGKQSRIKRAVTHDTPNCEILERIGINVCIGEIRWRLEHVHGIGRHTKGNLIVQSHDADEFCMASQRLVHTLNCGLHSARRGKCERGMSRRMLRVVVVHCYGPRVTIDRNFILRGERPFARAIELSVAIEVNLQGIKTKTVPAGDDEIPFALAHTFRQTGPFRAKNVDKRVRGLVFAGSSTTPGVGIPMVLISGKLAARRVAEMTR